MKVLWMEKTEKIHRRIHIQNCKELRRSDTYNRAFLVQQWEKKWKKRSDLDLIIHLKDDTKRKEVLEIRDTFFELDIKYKPGLVRAVKKAFCWKECHILTLYYRYEYGEISWTGETIKVFPFNMRIIQMLSIERYFLRNWGKKAVVLYGRDILSHIPEMDNSSRKAICRSPEICYTTGKKIWKKINN